MWGQHLSHRHVCWHYGRVRVHKLRHMVRRTRVPQRPVFRHCKPLSVQPVLKAHVCGSVHHTSLTHKTIRKASKHKLNACYRIIVYRVLAGTPRCRVGEYRSGSCEGTNNGYVCKVCNNTQCRAGQWRSGVCGGTMNGCAPGPVNLSSCPRVSLLASCSYPRYQLRPTPPHDC